MRVAGIMSGTSLDGIDVAIVDIEGSSFDVVAFQTTRYPSAVRQRLMDVSNAKAHVSEISRLNFLLPELYAKAIRGCKVPLESIELVGCHGQTIFHEKGSTLQIGDGSVLAERVGVPVVSDFRPRDIAAGGRGAPLVPFVDYLIYRDADVGRVALNIGGIANLTAIPRGAPPEDVIAFDTGPGNMVIDQLVSRLSKGKLGFDRGGKLARQGSVNQKLLDSLLENPYYRQRPPKTAGREQYGKEFMQQLIRSRARIEDLITTATAFTAATVAVGIQRFVSFSPDELIVSGGGAYNATLMGYLKAFLPETQLRTSDEFGIDSGAKEAIAFAILAYETFHRRASNLPSATGAKRPVILGKVSF